MSNYNKIYQFLRPIIFYIYDFRCYLCNLESFNLELHHKDKKVKNNSPFNLFPLCKTCHDTTHSGNFNIKFEVPQRLVNSLTAVAVFIKRSNI